MRQQRQWQHVLVVCLGVMVGMAALTLNGCQEGKSAVNPTTPEEMATDLPAEIGADREQIMDAGVAVPGAADPLPNDAFLTEIETPDALNAVGNVWRSACSGAIPSGAVRGGYESSGAALYVARANYGGGVHPGKVRSAFRAANIPYGGKELAVACYEVFVGTGRWVAASNGAIPAGALAVGREANGAALYAARAYYGGGLHPGKVRPGFPAAKIPYGGREVDVRSYEVLVSTGTPPSPAQEVRLNVPYKSQLDANCSRNNLCGYASTLMLTSHLHGTTPTTKMMQDMAQYTTGSRCPSRFSNFNEFVTVARARHLGNAPNSYWNYISYNQLKSFLRSGTPVEIGLRYGDLGNYRCYTNFSGGHSVVVVGFSEPRGIWWIHDPYCRSGGAYRAIPHSNFTAAIRNFSGGSIAAVVARR